MKMTVWKEGKTLTSKSKVIDHASVFVAIGPRDALRLIQSLSTQLADEDSNKHRLEFSPSGGSYFSLAIDWENVDTVSKVKARYEKELSDLGRAFQELAGKKYRKGARK